LEFFAIFWILTLRVISDNNSSGNIKKEDKQSGCSNVCESKSWISRNLNSSTV